MRVTTNVANRKNGCELEERVGGISDDARDSRREVGVTRQTVI